jgi:hypothetical protein
MTDFIEKLLRIRVTCHEYAGLDDLPIGIRSSYEINLAKTADIEFLVMKPTKKINLNFMRKHCLNVKKQSGLECVLILTDVTFYTKNALLEHGIPFAIDGKELYLPFLGAALSNRASRPIAHVDKISYTTQKLLLTAVYNKWRNVSVTEAAGEMDVAATTITKCFDELDALELSLIHKGGGKRMFIWAGTGKELWELIEPLLRTPVSKTYYLAEELKSNNLQLGGISAICHYTMLADNAYRTYAAQKRDKKTLGLDELQMIPIGEIPTAVVVVAHYQMTHITRLSSSVMDPVSAILSLSDTDRNDSRVEEAIEQIMEEYVW